MNNYLDCLPIDNHNIILGSSSYTVLFDQYNSFGFNPDNSQQTFSPHYYQKKSEIVEVQELLKSSLKQGYSYLLFDTSGSMAIEHAIHYSRLYTKKEKAIKFKNCYHGSTSLIYSLESTSALTLPVDKEDCIINTPTVSFVDSLKEIESRLSSNTYACIIIDPNFCDYYLTPPDWYFLELRRLCDQFNTLLVFDEMRTGFRSDQVWAVNKAPMQVDIVVGAKALCNGLPFSMIAIHENIFREKPFQIVDEALTGFSYNPFILSAIKHLLINLNTLFLQGNQTIQTLKSYEEEFLPNPLFNVKSKGNYLAFEFKTSRSTFAATMCEAKLKNQGALVYRSENRIILCPHYTFPINDLQHWLHKIAEISHETGLKFTPSV